jgi:hypothetical protein
LQFESLSMTEMAIEVGIFELFHSWDKKQLKRYTVALLIGTVEL